MFSRRLDWIDWLVFGAGAGAIVVIATAAAWEWKNSPDVAMSTCAAAVTQAVAAPSEARIDYEESFAWSGRRAPLGVLEPIAWDVHLAVDQRNASGELVRDYYHCDLVYDRAEDRWGLEQVERVAP